jgi:hypothetical protein
LSHLQRGRNGWVQVFRRGVAGEVADAQPLLGDGSSIVEVVERKSKRRDLDQVTCAGLLKAEAHFRLAVSQQVDLAKIAIHPVLFCVGWFVICVDGNHQVEVATI